MREGLHQVQQHYPLRMRPSVASIFSKFSTIWYERFANTNLNSTHT